MSTDNRAELRSRLDVQHAQISGWAEANGHDVVLVCRDEGVSGTTDAVDRPGLAAPWRRSRRG